MIPPSTRDFIVNVSGIVLLGMVLWQMYLYNTGSAQQKQETKKHLSVLIPILIIYVFSVPYMYPYGDLWARDLISTFLSINSVGTTGSGGLLGLIPMAGQQPTSLIGQVVYWLKLIGMVTHTIIFIVISAIPRAAVVGYDNLRELLGLEE